MKTSGIYGFHNIANGKWYVGQSLDVDKRRRKHLLALKAGYHRNEHLQNAFTIHGSESFEFHLLERVLEDMLDIRERAWIAYYDSANREHGYNIEIGGNPEKHRSLETRLKISLKKKGKPNLRRGWHHSPETRLKISLGLKNKPISDEHRLKLSRAHKGKLKSAQTRLRMSLAHQGKPHPHKTTNERAK